jgi:tripartite ATP-independent transporter DctM subunit
MGSILAFLGVAMILLLGSGVLIGLALMGIGLSGLLVFRDVPVVKMLGQIAWNVTTTAELASMPLFILMAEILFRTRISSQLFSGLAPLARRLPGRLYHVNVLGCTLFAAVSGSSAATAATVGKITVPELEKRGYARSLSLGSLAGAGTLGFLIPPSIVMIVYGVLAEVSIIKLFFAGVVPGLLLAFFFMAWIAIQTSWDKSLLPPKEPALPWGETLKATSSLIPVLGLVAVLIGSMYTGFATPNEAATVGVLGAVVLAGWQHCLSWDALRDAVMSSVRTTSMIGIILIGASFLTTAVGYLGAPRALVGWISELGLSPMMLIAALVILYVILGCFLDGISMIVMTLPLALPLVQAAGFSPIWFGVFLVVAVEMAMVTPPVGINLFVIQGLTDASLGEVARAAFPYFLIMLAFAFLLALWPGMVMIVPDLLMSK